MVGMPCFLIINVKYLEIESMNSIRFVLVRKFRICAHDWYLPLYQGKFFSPEKRGFENGLFSPFLVIFCFHNTKFPGVFLLLATVAASVNTDFKIFNMCTSQKDKHYF
jgi:hypothetical protein